MHGGAADRSGLIHVGDEVVEVNGINVEGKTPTDVLTILVRPSFCYKWRIYKTVFVVAKFGRDDNVQAGPGRWEVER